MTPVFGHGSIDFGWRRAWHAARRHATAAVQIRAHPRRLWRTVAYRKTETRKIDQNYNSFVCILQKFEVIIGYIRHEIFKSHFHRFFCYFSFLQKSSLRCGPALFFMSKPTCASSTYNNKSLSRFIHIETRNVFRDLNRSTCISGGYGKKFNIHEPNPSFPSQLR